MIFENYKIIFWLFTPRTNDGFQSLPLQRMSSTPFSSAFWPDISANLFGIQHKPQCTYTSRCIVPHFQPKTLHSSVAEHSLRKLKIAYHSHSLAS